MVLFFMGIGGHWQPRRGNGADGRPTEPLRHCAAQPVDNVRQAQTKRTTVQRTNAEDVARVIKIQANKEETFKEWRFRRH